MRYNDDDVYLLRVTSYDIVCDTTFSPVSKPSTSPCGGHSSLDADGGCSALEVDGESGILPA